MAAGTDERDYVAVSTFAVLNELAECGEQHVLDAVRSVELVMDHDLCMRTIQRFRNLTSVCIIGEPSLDSLAGLDSLTQLRALWVNQCSIEDVSALDRCTRLEKLFLCGNRIRAFNIRGLRELQVLWLNENCLTTLPSMDRLPNLRQLWVADNQLSVVLEAVAGNEQLEELNVSANSIYRIDEITGLQVLRKLSRLWLNDIHFGGNPVCRLSNWKITVLYQLPTLTMLDGDRLTEEHRFAAHSIHNKKCTAYAVRSKAAEFLICDLTRKVKKAAGQVRWKIDQKRRQLMRRIKSTTCEATREEALHKLQPLEELDQTTLARTSGFLQRLEEEKQMMLAAVLLEYSSGGNVRLETVHPHSPFVLGTLQQLSCATPQSWSVDRAYRIHNNGLAIQYEDALHAAAQPHERSLYVPVQCKPHEACSVMRHMLCAIQDGPTAATTQQQEGEAQAQVEFCVSPSLSSLQATAAGDILVVLLLSGFVVADPTVLCGSQLQWCDANGQIFCTRPTAIVHFKAESMDTGRTASSDEGQVPTHRTTSGTDTDSLPSEIWDAAMNEESVRDGIEQADPAAQGRLFEIEATLLNQWVDAFNSSLAEHNIDSDVKWITATATEPLAIPEFAQFPCAECITVIGYNLSNFSLFSGYFKLQELTASFAGLAELDPIAELTSLRVLDVSYNKIGSVRVLQSLTNIEQLNISHNRVAELKNVIALRPLTRLRTLEVWGNPFCKRAFARAKLEEQFGNAFASANPERLGWGDAGHHGRSVAVQYFTQPPSLIAALHPAWSRAVLGNCGQRAPPSLARKGVAQPPSYAAMYWSGGRKTDMPLDVLAQLSVLSLMHCDLEDLSARHLSPRLEELYLSGVALPTLAVLGGLTRLRRLDLINNGLRSLDGLPGFRRLVSLSVSNNKLTSLEQVTASDGVAELYAAHNNLTDLRCISSLCALHRLAVLSLAGNPLPDEHYRLYALFKLGLLKILDGQQVHAKEVAQAASAYAGRLTWHDLQDMFPGQELHSLSVLNLSNCGLRDISQLTLLQNLRELVANFNAIEGCCGLYQLQHLRKLELVENRIRKLSPTPTGVGSDAVASFPALETLNVSKNRIQELYPNWVQTFSSLRHLNLSHNLMERLEGLQGCQALTVLRFGCNKLRHIENLKDLPALRELSLEGNPLRYVRAIQLPSLTSVDLSNTKLSEYSHIVSFAECPALRGLSLIGCPLSLRPLYRFYVIRLLPSLLLLDGQQIVPEERQVHDDAAMACLPTVQYGRSSGGVYPLENKKLAHDASKISQQQHIQLTHNIIALPADKLSPRHRRHPARPPLLWHASSS